MPQNLLRFFLAASLFLYPAVAGAAVQVTVDDVVAGFETSASMTGLPTGKMLELHVIAPSGEDTAIPVETDSDGTAAATIPARLTEEAGVYRAFVIGGRRMISPETSFEVLSDRMNAGLSSITVSDPIITADGQDTAIVTVSLRDAQNNPLQGRPVQLVGSRTEDRITALKTGKESDREGRVQFAVQTRMPGEIALRAIDLISGIMLDRVGRIAARDDGLSMGGFGNDGVVRTYAGNSWTDANSQKVASGNAGSSMLGQLTGGYVAEPRADNRAYDVVDRFEVRVSTPTVKVGDVIPNFEIIAVDASGRTVESYAGAVRIETPGDPNATRPGLAHDHGEATITPKARGHLSIPWSVSFSKAGNQLIVVTDETGAIRGQTAVTVTGTNEIAENRRIRLENLRDGDTVNSHDILLHGKGPVFANLNVWMADGSTPAEEIASGDPDAVGETDDNGSFLISVVLPDSENVVLKIMDQNGQHDSGLIRLRVDTQGPALQVRFDPEQPREGDDVTINVASEPGLSDVTLAIRDQTITLTDIGTGDDGTLYQALFPALDRGDTEYIVSGRDSAGNVSEVQGQLAIYGPSIPQVQNLAARPMAGGIQLSWDAIPDDTITGYRIETKSAALPDAIILDTPEPTDGAAVMGLKSGNDYYLAVRALRDGEAGPRSSIISARTLGMGITVVPQEGSLLLQWIFPDATPLSGFLLEYGSAEAEYSENRTLDGAMRAYTINDLLVQPYLIRLTPVATTGEILRDLAVTTQGTPLRESVFHPSADELLLADASDGAPDNDLHAGADNTPASGLPGLSWHVVLGLTLIPALWYLYRRHKGMREARAFLRQMRRRYHQ